MTRDNPKNQSDPWLGIFCPEEACLREEEHIAMPSSPASRSDDDSAWLGIFCPEDRCHAETPTQVV